MRNSLLGLLVFFVCCSLSSADPARPSLPDRFTTIIEGNIVNKNRSFVVHEWYDYNLEKAKRQFEYGEYIYTIYEDFSDDNDEMWIYLQHADDTDNMISCNLYAYSNRSTFSFSHDESTSHHMKSSADWLDFYGVNTAVFEAIVGDIDNNIDENVRGILASKWTNHVYNVSERTSTSGEKYFRTEDYDIAFYWSLGKNWNYAGSSSTSSANDSVPIRVTIDGTRLTNFTNGTVSSYDFYHSYEYIGFMESEESFDDNELNFYYDMPDWIDECDVSGYCSFYPSSIICSEAQGPALPKLSNNFETIIEVTNLETNVTYLMNEYYDYDGNRGHIVIHSTGDYDDNAWHQLELDDNRQRWWWSGDATVEDGELTWCHMYLIDANKTGNDYWIPQESGHIASPSAWWKFNSTDATGLEKETWMGYTSVRNILAEKWKGNWNYEYSWSSHKHKYIVNSTIYYYFSKTGWEITVSNLTNVPLRIEVDSHYRIMNYSDTTESYSVFWKNSSNVHSYDIISFQNSGAKDDDFSIPVNWRTDCTISADYCNDTIYTTSETVCTDATAKLPTFPLKFEAKVELTDYVKEVTYFMEEYYDYEGNKAHVIYYGGQDGNFDESAYHQLEFFNSKQKWTWIGDADIEEDFDLTSCAMTLTLANNVTEFDGAILESADNHVARPSQWFRFDNDTSEIEYAGPDVIRGISASKWKGKWNMYDKMDESYYFIVNTTVTYWFSDATWNMSYDYNDNNKQSVPLRAYFDGYYIMYLWDTDTNDFSLDGTNTTIKFSYDFIALFTGDIDEDKFLIPENWRTQCTIDDAYCQTDDFAQTQDECDKGDDLPKLPQRFKTVIEANMVESNRTYFMEEYYDYNASKSLRIFRYQDHFTTVFEDFSGDNDEQWIYKQYSYDMDSVIECSLTAYSKQNRSHFFNHENSVTHHLSSSSEWFEFGSEFNETYLGTDYYLPNGIRGITGTRAWHRNVSFASTFSSDTQYNFDLTYYFSPKNWTFYGDNMGNGEIPLRATVNGNKVKTYDNGTRVESWFEHYYDYVGFAIGDDAFDSDEIFNFYENMPDWMDECNVTSYCDDYPSHKVCDDYSGPPLPDLSDSFTFIAEINDNANNKSYLLQEYYDYNGNRAHIAYYYDKEYSKHGYHQLELANDRQRWTWVGDATTGDSDDLDTCSMTLTKFDLTGNDLSVQLEHGHIARPSNWLLFGNNASYIGKETWMGYTTVRGINAEKWKTSYHRKSVYYNRSYETNATMYYYFTKNDWDMTFSNYDNSSIVLRAEINGVYSIYNYSKTDKDFTKYWKTETFDTWYEVIAFWNGTLDDSLFDIPSTWRQDCTIDSDYCSTKPNQAVCDSGPTSVPQFPKQFHTTVECKFLKNDYLLTIEEFYDYQNNRLRIIEYPFEFGSSSSSNSSSSTSHNYTTHYLENGVLLWNWKQYNKDSADPDSSTVKDCSMKRVEESTSEQDNEGMWWDTSSEHVASTNDFFHFATNLTLEHYYGTDTIRGIPVNVWKHDLETMSFSSDSFAYSANITVTYYFMTDEYKPNVYGNDNNNYDIPVRCDVTGIAHYSIGDYYDTTYNFENYYDFINFVPSIPDEFWFIPPSNTTCNFTLFCNDIPDDDEYDIYSQLCNDTNVLNNENVITDCYISTCGEISDIVSGNGRGDIVLCNDHKDDVPGWMWVVVVGAFLFGLAIGLIYHYRQRKKGQFRQIGDDQDDHGL